MKRKQKLVLVGILLLISLVTSSCGMSKKTSSNGSGKIPEYKKLENPDEDGFFLAIFGDPSPVTQENYKKLKECGIRTVFLDSWFGTENGSQGMKDALNFCEAEGLDVYIMINNTMNETEEQLRDFEEYFKEDYTKYSCFKGMYAFDEPRISQMDWMAENLKKWQNSQYKDHVYLVNLTGSDPDGAMTDKYVETYWEKVLSKNKDNILMYDQYPLTENVGGKYMTSIKDDTLGELEEMAFSAKEHDSKFFTFLQTWSAISRGEMRELVSVNDLRFQCALNMAYGSQGFACFTYCRLAQFGSAMTTFSGEPTDYWYWAQDVFSELKKWEHVYMAFDYEGTMTVQGERRGYGAQDKKHFENLRRSLTEHERIEKMDTEYDLLVGTFKDNEKNDGFLFTSYTDPYYMKNNEIDVTFKDASKALVYHNGELITNDKESTCYLLEEGRLKYTLEAGDYLFVIPVN